VVALGFGLTPLALAWLWAKVFSPAKPNAVKNAIYECGLESRGRRLGASSGLLLPLRNHVSDFLMWKPCSCCRLRVAFTGLGVAACVSMLVFVLMLVEGLAWAWARVC